MFVYSPEDHSNLCVYVQLVLFYLKPLIHSYEHLCYTMSKLCQSISAFPGGRSMSEDDFDDSTTYFTPKFVSNHPPFRLDANALMFLFSSIQVD